jgi:O-acetyl-ADP-ribose deacetylase (regulator of RNase III)
MVSYVVGNLFESPAQTLVNTVNTQGVMGKGIAKEFKAIFPNMFEVYQKACEAGELDIGNLFLYQTPHKLVLNFPTKRSWRLPSRPDYIEAGLQRFVQMYAEAGITSIAFPPLGCGNGELDFETTVRPLMHEYLSGLPIPVYIYAPIKTVEPVEHRNQSEIRNWLRQVPKALPFSEVWEDIVELVTKQRAFHTLTRDTTYQAEIEGDTVRVRKDKMTRVFKVEEIQELWRELRDHLVVTRYGLAERQRDVSYLFPILSALPYVECTPTGSTLQELTYNPAWALYLVPRPKAGPTRQRELMLLQA